MTTRVVRIDGCDPVRLTDSMQRGLDVVRRWHDGPTRARESNITDLHGRCVYWQAVRQLVSAHLIESRGPHNRQLLLTPLGVRVVYELDADRA